MQSATKQETYASLGIDKTDAFRVRRGPIPALTAPAAPRLAIAAARHDGG
ncbi:MAG: hypothetical protein KDJ34_14080 [Candidatus Competibacteraceae bacterium]|nr:hypothetical protein [Candidatus Competibacteraceae bacterium]